MLAFNFWVPGWKVLCSAIKIVIFQARYCHLCAQVDFRVEASPRGSHGDTESKQSHVVMWRRRNRTSSERKSFWVFVKHSKWPSRWNYLRTKKITTYLIWSEMYLKFHHSVEVIYCIWKKDRLSSSSSLVSYT